MIEQIERDGVGAGGGGELDHGLKPLKLSEGYMVKKAHLTLERLLARTHH
jgi:hypothetical protein